MRIKTGKGDNMGMEYYPIITGMIPNRIVESRFPEDYKKFQEWREVFRDDSIHRRSLNLDDEGLYEECEEEEKIEAFKRDFKELTKSTKK